MAAWIRVHCWSRSRSQRHGRMDAGPMQDFGGIQIADAGHGPLIEQRDLDLAAAVAEPFRKLIWTDRESVGTDGLVVEASGQLFER